MWAYIQTYSLKQVCVQPPTSADNVALSAFAAARRAALVRLLLTTGPLAMHGAAVDQQPGPQQQTRSSDVRRPEGTDGQTDGRTDGRPTFA